MRDVVENKLENKLEKYIKERIEENQKLFTEDETKNIKNTFELVKKIYLLGFLNAKNCYEI